MKHLKFPLLTLIICSFIIAFTNSPKTVNKNTKQNFNDKDAFAVLELFTSQGCSSCPAADKLLGTYAQKNDSNIIALAFHVDYWNRLGWKDPFSNAAYSRRQRDYAMLIEKSSVYTPQLIINGEKEMVGSDKEKVFVSVANALKQKASIKISINNLQISGMQLSVNYSVDNFIKNTTIHAALVQKQSLTNITKGENSGIRLANYNIVRDFVSNPLKNISSGILLTFPADNKNKEEFFLVLYIQDDASGKIIGATREKLS